MCLFCWPVALLPHTPHLCLQWLCVMSLVVHSVLLTWRLCGVCLASDPGPAQIRPSTPSNSDVSSFLSSFPPFFHSFYSFLLIVPPLFSHIFLLTISPLPLHLLLAPLAVPVAGSLDSVVVSALRHNLRLLGGAGPPVALQRRHSVCAHYRHNLLLSPVSKPMKPPHPEWHHGKGCRREKGWRAKEGRCLLCLQPRPSSHLPKAFIYACVIPMSPVLIWVLIWAIWAVWVCVCVCVCMCIYGGSSHGTRTISCLLPFHQLPHLDVEVCVEECGIMNISLFLGLERTCAD